MMEIKKVQEVKGSYYIYLPKAWCKKYIITAPESKSPREVQLKQNDDDSLLILPRNREILESLELTLHHNLTETEASCLNSVLAGYIVGLDRIILETKKKFSLNFRDKISQLLKQLIGFEITAETPNKIVMQEVSTTLELDGMMRQLLSKVSLILNYISDIMKTHNLDEARLVISQDDETDKFRYSIERQVHQILRQPHLARELRIPPIECHHFSQCTKHIERIADHCVDLANLILEGKKPSAALIDLYQGVCELYNHMKLHFYPQDVEANYEIINHHYELLQKLDDLELKSKEDQPFAIHLKRICGYCSDIAEVRINSFVYKEAHGSNPY